MSLLLLQLLIVMRMYIFSLYLIKSLTMHHVLYMYMSFIFARFFVCVHFSSVSICPLCFFLLWAASYDGLVPSLAACHCYS